MEYVLGVKAEAEKKIAEADAKANPIRNKVREFTRTKNQRPIDINSVARTPEVAYSGGLEQASSSPLTENAPESANTSPESSSSPAPEITPSSVERPTVGVLVSTFNQYLKDKFGPDNVTKELINQQDFLRTIRRPDTYQLDLKDFKKIVLQYYKIKKIPLEKINSVINKFEIK
jgi:hypothetical protein